MGKGWAKGLRAATDVRVARGAAAHRGKRYVRRTPIAECRWRRMSGTSLPLSWSDDMAYLVGLTATDGCLYLNRRRLNFKSRDRELVDTYLRLLGRTNRIKSAATRIGGTVYFTEFHDTALYGWFLSIGIGPRKSLSLGALNVPDEFLMPLVRGLLDGDGSILNKVYRADTGRRPDYFWEYLQTKFTPQAEGIWCGSAHRSSVSSVWRGTSTRLGRRARATPSSSCATVSVPPSCCYHFCIPRAHRASNESARSGRRTSAHTHQPSVRIGYQRPGDVIGKHACLRGMCP